MFKCLSIIVLVVLFSPISLFALNIDADSNTATDILYGGTNASTLTDGGVLLGSGTEAITPMGVLTDGQMIVGDGTTDPVAESGATLRTSIGLGTGDTPQFTGVELGHTTDTTITRLGPGKVAVETIPLLDADDLDNTAYDATSWDGNVDAATKNAIRDKFETLGGGGDVASSSTITDHSIVRGDGGVKGVQETGWIISDINILSLSDNYAGLLGSFITNTNADAITVAGAVNQVMNDLGYFGYFGMTSSASTIGSNAFQNTLHLYNQGYADTLYTVDGDKDHVWYSDPTDQHNFTGLSNEIMRLFANGDLTLTGDLGLTGTRVNKGWFTDLEVTNAIAGSLTGEAATVATIAGLPPDTATTQATQPNITSLGTLVGLDMGGNPITNVPAPTLDTHPANKLYVDTAVGFSFDYFFGDTSDAIGGIYYVMTDDDLGGAQSNLDTVVGSTGDDKPLVNFITPAGEPGVTQLESGIYEVHIHAEKTAGGSTVDGIYWELHKRETDTTETLLGTSEVSNAVTSEAEYNIHLSVSSPVTIATTDRLLIKFYANLSGGAGATVRLIQEGTTAAHFEFQTTSSILSNIFVRQDGTTELTADWDAGPHGIRAETLESDVATGTPPITVASTTEVANLRSATATALAANGSNCNAGEYSLGVDEAGAVESCTNATTEIDSAILTHKNLASDHHSKAVIDDTAYNSTSWNTNEDAATKNSIRDKFESLGVGGTITAVLDDTTGDVNVFIQAYTAFDGSDATPDVSTKMLWKTADTTTIIDFDGSPTDGQWLSVYCGHAGTFDLTSSGITSANRTTDWTMVVGSIIDFKYQNGQWYAQNIPDAVASIGSNGLIARTSATTAEARTLQGGTGITVTNGDGVSGNPSIAMTDLITLISGTASMGTIEIASGACASTVQETATGAATTDVIGGNFNASPLAVTGYAASANGGLHIVAWATSNNVNFSVCNNTDSAITPGAITLNWQIVK